MGLYPHTHASARWLHSLAQPRQEILLGARLYATYRLQVVKRKMLDFTGK